MEFEKFTIKNYKCFDNDGCTIDTLKPINVIIGKNNSGKSSLLEVFKFLTTKDDSFFNYKRNGSTPEIMFEHILNSEDIHASFPKSVSGGDITMNHYQYGLKFIESKMTYKISTKNTCLFDSLDVEFANGARKYFEHCASRFKSPFHNNKFIHLNAERDIQPETQNLENIISNTGVGATNLIQNILNRDIYDSHLIESKLLDEINKIVNPDIKFSRILVQSNDSNVWEIYFENPEDGRIPLSKMGSGIKTILLVLISLHVDPYLSKISKNNYVFAFEELENNLHPSMQRRLYLYLKEYSINHECLIFLTTHSNVVIDLFNAIDRAQIFHIYKNIDRTNIRPIFKYIELKVILDDLDVRASDILQSNGIIWVEGPSDRNFIKAWLEILNKNYIEGIHYSIMFYGGRLLSNLTFNEEIISDELIPLLKINKNAFVVMDRDGFKNETSLNRTKKRIINEIGKNSYWVTKGIEIENYLSNDLVNKWLRIDNFKQNMNKKFGDNIRKHFSKFKYESDKNKYSKELAELLNADNYECLDITKNLNSILKNIEKWNP